MILFGGRVYAPGEPGATAVVIRGNTISYVGDDAGARQHRPGAPEVDLGGRLLTPAFVDAHLHAVQAGLVMTGLDLHDAGSRTEVLDRLAAYAARHPAASVILGQGWDERAWPDPRPPTRAELDRAAGDRPVYLARVDVHSAVVSSAVLDRLPGLAGCGGVLRRRATDPGRPSSGPGPGQPADQRRGPPGRHPPGVAAGGEPGRGRGARARRPAPRSGGGSAPGARGRGRAGPRRGDLLG